MWHRHDASLPFLVSGRMSRFVRSAQSRAPHLDVLEAGSFAGRRAGLVLAVLSALLLAGCRADSLTTPLQSTECGGEPGCRPSQNVPVDPAVIAAVDDARERLVPTLDDAAAREALAGVLQGLREKLEANRNADARVRLALVFVELDRLRVRLPGEEPIDLPDMSAIRLALVPVAKALGVQTAS
jgi:hypothetical protein